jgi:hypothetical protein
MRHSIDRRPTHNASNATRRAILLLFGVSHVVVDSPVLELLFRSVFLQTRSYLMAFLSAIPTFTERGQRLARCVRVLKLKLSRNPSL